MDPQRIEEFRNKLREGRPVRVVGGQVVLDGMPDPNVRAGASPSQAPRQGVGVHVKPHEWGA